MIYSDKILPSRWKGTDKTKFQNNTTLNSKSHWNFLKKQSLGTPLTFAEISFISFF